MRLIFLVLIVLICPLRNSFAAAVSALGLIEGPVSSKKPVKELTDLIAANPKETLFVVTGRFLLTEHVTDHYKWFYDSESKELVRLSRSTIASLPETLDWVVWHDVKPADFLACLRFEYDETKIKMTRAPQKMAVRTFYEMYANKSKQFLEATKWP